MAVNALVVTVQHRSTKDVADELRETVDAQPNVPASTALWQHAVEPTLVTARATLSIRQFVPIVNVATDYYRRVVELRDAARARLRPYQT